MSQNTYAQDLAVVRARADVLELAGEAGRSVAVVPAWQGRVMTSTTSGQNGPSFGWLNEAFISAGAEDPVFNNFGGEDRFWLGPEAGQFGLWFAEGDPFDLAHWRTPEGFNTGPFEVVERTEDSVGMARQFDVTNFAGTAFHCGVQRTVRALGKAEIAEKVGLDLPAGAEAVAFESENVLANVGEEPWTQDGGLPSIWILGQFKPLARGRVIVPIRAGNVADFGPKATTDYFGQIPQDRCSVGERHVLFSCDGAFRSKIGISPRRSKGVIGSYDPDAGALTIVKFNQPLTAAELPYVNSLWEV